MYTVYNNLKKELAVLEQEIQSLQQEIEKLPEGKLLCVQNGAYVKWYKSNGAYPIYIKKREEDYAKKLAIKKYNCYRLEELKGKYSLLKKYADFYEKEKEKSKDLVEQNPAYASLLADYLKDTQDKSNSWQEGPYPHNAKYKNNLIYKTLAGHMVRSKSEVLIANALFLNGIPYRYEYALQLEGITLYPDFTIRHPKTKQIYYWEHFGMADKLEYQDRITEKLKLYLKNGIIPTIDLILSYETSKSPLDIEKVEWLIREYF